ncbi:MAG: ribose transport system substrate-binding protein [Planctomycetota bacterium]
MPLASLPMSLARYVLLLSSFLLVTACGDAGPAGVGGGDAGSKTAKARVVVIPKGTTHVFWQAVDAGAQEAASRTNLDVMFKGPLSESDRSAQKQLMQQFIGEGVAGIALAPLDAKALVPDVKRAKAKGIPVVIFDSALEGTVGEDFASFIATDNGKSGELAGVEMARLLGNKGKVVVLRYQVGSASTTAREEGFLKAARAAGLEIMIENRHAGDSIGKAKTAALNMADALKKADGVFCPCEPVTNGMMLALDQLGMAGKLKFVGFDVTKPLKDGLRAGKIDALVVQNPRRMGQLAVEHLALLIAGKTVEKEVDTGCVLATKANMEEPEIAALLK